MGTWGPGPFDNDTAEDFLEELEEQSVSRRMAAIKSTFRSAIEVGGSINSSVLPEEVVVAAAVVSANVPSGISLAWNEDYPGITEWLSKPILPALASSVIQALEVTFPADSRLWQRWVDAGDREESQAVIDSLKSVLSAVSLDLS